MKASELFEKYAIHDPNCLCFAINVVDGKPKSKACDCGYDQALAEVKKQEAANERLKAFIKDWPDGHTPGCLMNLERTSEEQPEPYCDCGYTKAKRQALKGESCDTESMQPSTS